jgi:MOSC domain-containing protein YiiM
MRNRFTRVEKLFVNDKPTGEITVTLDGIVGDDHFGPTRRLNEHDSRFLKLSGIKKYHWVSNNRSWSAISREEIDKIEKELGVKIPDGCLLENLVISGIREFSQLPSGTQLVFPEKPDGSRVILAVWRQNTPCGVVGKRLQSHYPRKKGLSDRFIKVAEEGRGLVGFVISGGYIDIGDIVMVFTPDI